MKRIYSILVASVLFGAALPQAGAAAQVSVDFFHDSLDS